MEKIIPVLQIDDYREAVDFYVERLGFSIVFEHRHEPGFPVFMAVRKGDLFVQLSEHGRGHSGSEIYIYVDDIHAWHERCLAHGIAPEQQPTAQPWGNTEMLVKDPFRNALRFSQEKTHAGTNTPNGES
ncbi:MAG: glyoxalase superfamily protein [Phycisphaerae bacterium]|nr:glyoxalase superfamily protein [Phycisphaerae bacterium]